MRYTHFTVIAFLLSLMSFAQLANASTITPVDGQGIYKAPSTVEDVLVVSPPNEAGISINYFSEFVVQDKALKLVNSPVNHGEGEYDDAAMLVVVIANDISISNQVELLGPASDILFLSRDSDGRISCSNCSFENFYRITLAVAETESTFPVSGGLIGKLSTTSSGEISIGDLTARGSLAVETLAKTVTLDGLIETHDRADAEGLANINGYSQNQNGNFTIGTGSVNLMLGQMEWDYDSQTIKGVTPTNTDVTLNGTIHSVEVKITSADSISLNTDIDTKVDLLSTTQYKGLTYLPEESIKVQDFGKLISYLQGRISSYGVVDVNVGGALNLIDSQSLSGIPLVRLISVSTFYNEDVISADNIYIAAGKIINQGVIKSSGAVELWAYERVVNQFGGEIYGGNLLIETKGAFKNGSRTPFLSIDGGRSVFGSYYGTGLFFWDNRENVESGAYYQLHDKWESILGENNEAQVKPEKTHALIVGNNIKIKSLTFENINPYWEYVVEEFVDLDVDLMKQVGISAENELVVDASKNVINSSAYISVKSEGGVLKIKGSSIVSERYRTLNLLDKKVSNGVESIVTKSYTYSPPGYITSLGHLEIKATLGFMNDTSYLEVFGDAYFDAPKVRDVGIVHDDIEIDKKLTCVSRKLRWSCLDSSTLSIQDPKESDSLFYVHGDSFGKEGSLLIENIKIDEIYMAKAIQLAEDKVTAPIPTYSERYAGKSSIIDGDNVIVNWTYSPDPCVLGCRPEDMGIIRGSSSFSLYDLLLEIYNSIIEMIESVIEEIKWWDDEE